MAKRKPKEKDAIDLFLDQINFHYQPKKSKSRYNYGFEPRKSICFPIQKIVRQIASGRE